MGIKNGLKLLAGISALATLALLSLTGNQKAFAETTNQTNVTVQVAQVTQITVLPNVITWSSVNPGAIGGMTHIQVRNSGSVNVSNIYGYADTLTSEPNNPYPTGSPSAFSSGSVLMLRRNETEAAYYYADRLDWNITQPAGAGGANCQNAVAWGYYRNVSNEYVWCLTNGTVINATHGCNSTGTTLYIESDADNGTAGSRQPDVSATLQAGIPDWGILYFTSGPLNGYCVAANQNCTKILIYEYDKRTNPNFGICTESSYIRTTTLTPGDEFTLNLDAWVPKGVPYGWLASSWLTIEGTGA